MSDMVTADRRNGALLADSVLQRLREEIITGGLPPGTPLSVPGIASRLGVSRSPVREAVQQLTVDGVAEYRPHAGARVAVLDRTTLEQVFELREVLDGKAAGQATARVTQDEIVELREMLEVQERNLAGKPDPVRDSRIDLAFHTRIREISANRPLCEVLARLDIQGYLYRSDAWHSELNARMSLQEHLLIVDALERGDVHAASAAASSHAGAVLVRILRG